MPRIATNERIIQTTALRVAPQQEVSADAFGAGLGQDIQRTAGIIRGMEGQEWDRANRAKVDDAAAQLAAKRLELGNRLKAAKGEQALAIANEIEKEFADTTTEVESKLANDAQRDAFRGDAQRLGLGLRETVDGHVIAQGEIVAQQKADARASTMFQSGIANRNDELMAWTDLQDAQATLETYDRSQGVPQEARDARQQALRSKFTADAIEALADDGNHLAAQKWLEGYRGQLKNPADLKRAEAATKAASTRGESQRLVDGIMARPESNIETAMAEAAKIADPELRAAVEQRAVTMLGLRERMRDEQAANLMADLYTQAKASPLGLEGINRQSDLEALGRIDPKKRQQLEAWAKREAAAEVKGQSLPWQVSAAKRYEIEAKASTPEGRTKFAGTDLRPLLMEMNEDDWNKLDSYQKEINKAATNGGTAAGDTAWLTSREDVVNESLAGLGIDPRPYVTKDGKTTPNEAAIGFRREVEQEANALAATNKRTKPNIEDVRKAADTVMLKKVRLDEWGTDPEMVAATVPKDRRGNAYVPVDQIEPGKAQAIRELIRQNGGTPTDARVQRVMAARLLGDRALLDQILKER